MSSTVDLPTGLSDQLEAVKAASTQLGKRFAKKMCLVDEIVDSVESGRQLEATQVLYAILEIMDCQIDVKERAKALAKKVGKYYNANVYFKCHCLKVLRTIDELEAHQKDEHNKGDEYICDGCGKIYKIKGAFENHQEKNQCQPLLERRASELAQRVYEVPPFLPAPPRTVLPPYPPYIDTRHYLYAQEGPFPEIPTLQGSADPTSFGSSHPEAGSQGHLGFLPQAFAAHTAYHPPPTSGQDPIPFSSPLSGAPACNPPGQDQAHIEEVFDGLPRLTHSFWDGQVQSSFSVVDSNTRRPSDPYPFRAQGPRPQQLDGHREDLQPPIKRRRSEHVSRKTPRSVLPAKIITSTPLQASPMLRFKQRSPKKSKSQSPARNTSPDIDSEPCVRVPDEDTDVNAYAPEISPEATPAAQPSSIPVRSRSRSLSSTATIDTGVGREPRDEVAANDEDISQVSSNTGVEWSFHQTDVYSGVPVPISLETPLGGQQSRHGSQVMEPGQQYQLSEHNGADVNLVEASGSFSGFATAPASVPASTYPSGHIAGMDPQHPGHPQYFGGMFPGQEVPGWGHFTVPDWTGRGHHGGTM